MITWKGYRFFKEGKRYIYSVELEDSKFDELYKYFKNCKSQKEFYFKYVNPLYLFGRLTNDCSL